MISETALQKRSIIWLALFIEVRTSMLAWADLPFFPLVDIMHEPHLLDQRRVRSE